MEFGTDRGDVDSDDLGAQARVDALGEAARIEGGVGVEAEHLRPSVDAGVGPPRHVDLVDRSEDRFEHGLQLADHRSHPGVRGQSTKTATVVGDGEPDPLCHSVRG